MARQLTPSIKFPKSLLTLENLSGLGRLIRQRDSVVYVEDLWDGEPVADGSYVLYDYLMEKHPDLLVKPMGLLLPKAVPQGKTQNWIRWDETQAYNALSHTGKRAYGKCSVYRETYGHAQPTNRLLSHYHDQRDVPSIKSGKKHSPCSDRIRLYFYLGQGMPSCPVWVIPGHRLTGTATPA